MKVFISTAALLILCIVLWLSSPKIIDLFNYLYGTNYQDRGVFGDSFGAVTSLFSSLSFIAVLFVLYRSQENDSLKEKPFLITRPSDSDVHGEFFAESNCIDFNLKFRVLIKNYSEYLAHSIKIKASIFAKDTKHGSIEVKVFHPVSINEISIPDILINLKRKSNDTVLDVITSDLNLNLQLEIEYKNILNKTFKTSNLYVVHISERDKDSINEFRYGKYEEKNWGGGKFKNLDLKESVDFIK